MVIDDTELSHFGASLKNLGKKRLAFTKMEMGAVDVLSNLKKVKLASVSGRNQFSKTS